MKQGMFQILLFVLISFCFVNNFADDLDDFLIDAPLSKESVLIDIEGDTRAEFDIVDGLTKRKKTLEESLIIPPKYNMPRTFGQPVPFTAQLRKGAVLTDLKSGKPFRVKKPLVVKAELVYLGSKDVFILNKSGEKRYETRAENAVNIENTVRLNPDINPLIVYTDKKKYGSTDEDLKFSHFFSYHIESIRSDYYSTIFRGERQSATGNIFEVKNYFITDRFPIQIGFNINAHFGFWEDPELGIVTWRGVFVGPSVMRTFWQKPDGRWNFHVSAFQSVYHQSKKNPDTHNYSTLGLQSEIEKEFDTTYGPVTLGLSYRWSRSSIKDSTEYLENEALKGQVIGFGAYLSYRYNWSY
ncbi:MAG: hypothetical protein K9K67_00525 [Bacteriovoracaceae bacterium]|nr:hypothetical protein [Bacteriovoracaceae bacterium]